MKKKLVYLLFSFLLMQSSILDAEQVEEETMLPAEFEETSPTYDTDTYEDDFMEDDFMDEIADAVENEDHAPRPEPGLDSQTMYLATIAVWNMYFVSPYKRVVKAIKHCFGSNEENE